jgi:hypothetical protein
VFVTHCSFVSFVSAHLAHLAKKQAVYRAGSTPLKRGQAAHAASTSHLGRRPRHLGISAGGTEKLNSSSTDQR